MDKLIVDANGKAIISNDGATIVGLLNIVHPAARALVDIAKSQDAEVCLLVFSFYCLIFKAKNDKNIFFCLECSCTC